MLSYALLCSPVLSHALLCSPMLSYALLCSPVLSCALLCSPVLCNVRTASDLREHESRAIVIQDADSDPALRKCRAIRQNPHGSQLQTENGQRLPNKEGG